MFNWQVAFALELLVILFGFWLWFVTARAEAGPKKLAKIVAIVIIILAVLLGICTLTKAVLFASGCGTGGAGGMPCRHMGPGGMAMPPHGPGMGGMGMMGGPGSGGMGMMGGYGGPATGEAPPGTAEETAPE